MSDINFAFGEEDLEFKFLTSNINFEFSGSAANTFVWGATIEGTSSYGININNNSNNATAFTAGMRIGFGFNTNSAYNWDGLYLGNENNAGVGINTGIYVINYSQEKNSTNPLGSGIGIQQVATGGTVLGMGANSNVNNQTNGFVNFTLSNTQSDYSIINKIDTGTSLQDHISLYLTGTRFSMQIDDADQAPSVTTNKLYALSGGLYWNGNLLEVTPVDDGTEEGQTLRWDVAGNKWETNDIFYIDQDESGTGALVAAGKRIAFGVNQYGIGYNILAYTGESITSNALQIFANNDATQGVQIGGDNAATLGLEISGLGRAMFHQSVGIATATPRKPLDVLSTVGAQQRWSYTDNSVYGELEVDSSGLMYLTSTGNHFVIQGTTSGVVPNLDLKGTNANARMRFFNSNGVAGSLQSGVTAFYITSPIGSALAMQSGANDPCSVFQNVTVTTGTNYFYIYGWNNVGGSVKRWGRFNYFDGYFNMDCRNGSGLRFLTGQLERARFLSTGEFGIGTTTPDADFHLKTTDDDTSNFHIAASGNSNTQAGMWLHSQGDTSAQISSGCHKIDNSFYARATEAAIWSTGEGKHRFYADTSLTEDATFAPTEVVIIETGKVGINETSPSTALDVKRTIGAQMRLTYTTGSNFCNFAVNSSGQLDINPTVAFSSTVPAIYLQGDTNTGFSIPATDQLSLIAGGIEGLRITTTETQLKNGQNVNITTVNAATYSLLATDYVLHVTYTTTGACTITLPTAQSVAGRVITIKDAGNNAVTNNITIATGGAELIEFGATYLMATSADSKTFYSDGTDWFLI